MANETTKNLADQLKEKNEELEYLVEERTKELKERETRLRSIVENSLTGISIIQDNRVVYQNPEQESLFGPLPRSPKFIDADSVAYLSVEGMKKSVGHMKDKICCACFTGEYPLPVKEEQFIQLRLFEPI